MNSTAERTTPTRLLLPREDVASSAKQSWGFWTQSKLQILDDYLAAFLTASSLRAKGAVYLDAFTGEGAGGEWRPIVDARRRAAIGGDQAREAFVNVMRWRLAHDLGYERTHVLEFKNSRGVPLYHMVFASDHETGDKIMAGLYATAANRNQDMAQDALEHKTGVQSLFAPSKMSPLKYKATPPVEPSDYLQALLKSPTDAA